MIMGLEYLLSEVAMVKKKFKNYEVEEVIGKKSTMQKWIPQEYFRGEKWSEI
jgi:hypothetical protein